MNEEGRRGPGREPPPGAQGGEAELELDLAITGVKLTGVTPGSPAEAAGMTKGDVLLSLAGQELGQTVAARWSRDGAFAVD